MLQIQPGDGRKTVRVIAGEAKGRKLQVPKGQDIRPVTDLIKGAIFNTLGPVIQGCSFLDLFAGSGAMGIEALSRGAGHAVFVDSNPAAVRVIKENLVHCRLESRASVWKADVKRAVSRLSQAGEHFDIVFIDPPFRKAAVHFTLLEPVQQLMKDSSIVIIRLPAYSKPAQDEFPGGLSIVKTSVYGDSVVYYLCRIMQA